MAKNSNSYEDGKFAEFLMNEVITDVDMGAIAGYIGSEWEPDDIFDDSELIEWAREKDPEDIYGGDVLSEWAFQNGYVEAE